ncbi:hypothetical protein KC357_g282 [Hortaea werneckii]|nr:hypothetical protein KC357_g282 [Hortaea werneckii]
MSTCPFCVFRKVPSTLHIKEITKWAADSFFPGKHAHSLDCLGILIIPELVFRTLGVDVAVLDVHFAGLVHGLGCLSDVTRVLENTSARHVIGVVRGRWVHSYGGVDVLLGLVQVARENVVIMQGKEIVDAQFPRRRCVRRRRLDEIAVRCAICLPSIAVFLRLFLQIAFYKLLNRLLLCRIRIKLLDICKCAWHTLLEHSSQSSGMRRAASIRSLCSAKLWYIWPSFSASSFLLLSRPRAFSSASYLSSALSFPRIAAAHPQRRVGLLATSGVWTARSRCSPSSASATTRDPAESVHSLVPGVERIEQAIHVPADVRLHGVLECKLTEVESLFGLALAHNNESLHRLCIAMVGVFPQNLIGGFETLLVLLGLVVLDDLFYVRSRRDLRTGMWWAESGQRVNRLGRMLGVNLRDHSKQVETVVQNDWKTREQTRRMATACDSHAGTSRIPHRCPPGCPPLPTPRPELDLLVPGVADFSSFLDPAFFARPRAFGFSSSASASSPSSAPASTCSSSSMSAFLPLLLFVGFFSCSACASGLAFLPPLPFFATGLSSSPLLILLDVIVPANVNDLLAIRKHVAVLFTLVPPILHDPRLWKLAALCQRFNGRCANTDQRIVQLLGLTDLPGLECVSSESNFIHPVIPKCITACGGLSKCFAILDSASDEMLTDVVDDTSDFADLVETHDGYGLLVIFSINPMQQTHEAGAFEQQRFTRGDAPSSCAMTSFGARRPSLSPCFPASYPSPPAFRRRSLVPKTPTRHRMTMPLMQGYGQDPPYNVHWSQRRNQFNTRRRGDGRRRPR